MKRFLRRHDTSSPSPRWGSLGFQALDRADAALAMGDKVGALRAYGQAYSALRSSHMTTAPEAKMRAANAILSLTHELGGDVFGPDLCPHGQSKNLACWACADMPAEESDPPTLRTGAGPAIAKAEPSDLEIAFGFRSEREADAEIIVQVDETNERKRVGGGS